MPAERLEEKTTGGWGSRTLGREVGCTVLQSQKDRAES